MHPHPSVNLASLGLLASLLGASASCQVKSPPVKLKIAAAPADYSKEAVVYDSVATTIDMQADGTGVKILTVGMSVQSENAVHEAGLLTFSYAAGNEKLEVEYVRVRKPGGALDTLEKGTAQLHLGNLSREDIGNMRQMIATWDTMAWIYFREGNMPLAEEYARASWKASQHKEVGAHLHDIYEKEGRLKEAEGLAGEDLQKERTMTLHNVWQGVSADFYLLLSADGLADLQFVTGDETLRAALPAIRRQTFSGYVPKGSEARLFRRGILYCSQQTHVCEFTLIPEDSTTLN